MRLCSVSVDVDPLSCYYVIHGLGAPPPGVRDLVVRRGLERFAEMFEQRGIRATFFVVGSDVAGDPAAGRLFAALARAGHELGNHSQTHPYELARLGRERIEDEVSRAHDAIAAAAGVAPVGFRAPGYDVSSPLLAVLAALGYRYDSSIFPSWPYYLAKTAVMGAMRMRGRRSGSVMGDPRALLAPALPYRPGSSPFRRGDGQVVELPVAVSPRLRLPAIGFSLLMASSSLRTRLLKAMRARPFFNLELHGIELVGAEEDGVPAELVARQPDLRLKLAQKRSALESILDQLGRDYRFVPLKEVAERVGPNGVLELGDDG